MYIVDIYIYHICISYIYSAYMYMSCIFARQVVLFLRLSAENHVLDICGVFLVSSVYCFLPGRISYSHIPFLLQRPFFPGTTEMSAFGATTKRVHYGKCYKYKTMYTYYNIVYIYRSVVYIYRRCLCVICSVYVCIYVYIHSII